jgi:hypothetical protein
MPDGGCPILSNPSRIASASARISVPGVLDLDRLNVVQQPGDAIAIVECQVDEQGDPRVHVSAVLCREVFSRVVLVKPWHALSCRCSCASRRADASCAVVSWSLNRCRSFGPMIVVSQCLCAAKPAVSSRRNVGLMSLDIISRSTWTSWRRTPSERVHFLLFRRNRQGALHQVDGRTHPVANSRSHGTGGGPLLQSV